ncbi:MAG: PASTA domain-containing protein [Actinotalea sp.]|nr:PASTA domain-containing protein [Actinotalea sp.]
MMRSSVRPALAGLAAAAVLLTSACSAQDEPAGAQTPAGAESTAESTPDQTAEEQTEDGPVDVPNVTGLILVTAESNLMLAGLESETVDETGAPVEVEDALTYLVVGQDPTDGELERGETVTLTVAPRG